MIAPPRVAESPVAFECKVLSVQQFKNHKGDLVNSWMIFGEVVAVHIDKRFLVNGVYDTAAAHPVLRGGGPADYFELGPLFKMYRPK